MACYLVTGGAGFIGSHLAESLIADGHAVRVLDDLSSGREENLPRGVDLITADVTSQVAVRRVLRGIDGCFHLAAIASVERCHTEWLRSHSVNLGGTVTVFEEIRRAQQSRGRPLPVVYASSAAVYGDTTEIPIFEETKKRPLSAYAVDKLASEMHATVASRVHNLNTLGLRFFNVYGPRQDPNSPYSGVITIFCRRVSQGLPFEIHGDGMQIRDFIYVGDVVTALRRAMNAANSSPQVFNICTGVGTPIARVGEMIAQIRGAQFAPRYVQCRIGDLRVSVGDPRRAQKILGFSAQTSLQHGLAQTLTGMTPQRACSDAPDQSILSAPPEPSRL